MDLFPSKSVFLGAFRKCKQKHKFFVQLEFLLLIYYCIEKRSKKSFKQMSRIFILRKLNAKIHFLNGPKNTDPPDPQISNDGKNSDGRQTPSNYGKSILIPI